MCKIRVEIQISEVLEQKRRGIVKKKKILTEVFLLFFVAAVFMAVYVVIEMGNDWLAVLGGAAVLLISAYLLIDYLLESKMEGSDAFSDGGKSGQRLGELEDVQKAMYTVMKRGAGENAELLRGLDARITELTRVMSQLVDTTVAVGTEQEAVQKELLQVGNGILDAVKSMRQDYQVGVKNLIKYEKENARQIAETAHTNTEMTIIELSTQFAKILESLQSQKEQIEFLRLSTMNAPFSIPSRNAEPDDADADALLPVLDDALIPVEDPEEGTTDGEDPDGFDAEAAIKAYMAEQGFDIEEEEDAEEVTEAPQEEPQAEPQEEDRSAPMSEEEIANTLQSMATGDPNRALTPEEIAAMFAAVQ